VNFLNVQKQKICSSHTPTDLGEVLTLDNTKIAPKFPVTILC